MTIDTGTQGPAPAKAREPEKAASPQGARRGPGVTGRVLTGITWVFAVLFFFPIFWMVVTGFKQESDAYTETPRLVFNPTLDQFATVFDRAAPFVVNSTVATVVSTLLVLLLAIPAAYALSIRPVEKTQDVLFFFISTRMLPVVAVIVPLYVIAGEVKALDNLWVLIVLYTSMNLPIAVWMMRSFMQEIPGEVLEAASMDGAGLAKLWRHVLVPMVAPGIAATALICVIFAWNEFFFAVNLTASASSTLPVYLVGFITSQGLYFAQLSAAATLASLPVVIAGWIAQKQLVRGLSMGAIK
jgi:sorbitol/mannitol transport system permease protein